MGQKLPNSAHFSQIETRKPLARVVLLGASNLSMALPRVISSTRAAFDAPLEFFIAAGFGRSYGQESKIFWKKFLGILQSDLWAALDRAAPLPTAAIVADVGNDLAYEAPVETVFAWVTTTIDQLANHGARIALNNLPIASLRTVGAVRYLVLRSALFPACRLARTELLQRAEVLSAALVNFAETREIPAFSADAAWYGLDPIHPRRRHAGAIWRQMIDAVNPRSSATNWTTLSRADARLLRAARSAYTSRRTRSRASDLPRIELSDGSTVALF